MVFFDGVVKDASWTHLTWGKVLVMDFFPLQLLTHGLLTVPRLKSDRISKARYCYLFLPSQNMEKCRQRSQGQPGLKQLCKVRKSSPETQQLGFSLLQIPTKNLLYFT